MLVVFTDLYGRQMGKRFDAEFFISDAVQVGTHGCDYLLTVDMEMEPVPGYRFANWERGYGDVHLVPDMETLRVASWLDRTAMVLCDVEVEVETDVGTEVETGNEVGDGSHHQPVSVAPRSLLRRQIDAAKQLGFSAQAASELEYFIFNESYREAAAKSYSGLEPAGWYIEDYHALQGSREEAFNGAVRRHLKRSGVPVENSKGEWGLGQHELNVRYADILTMADRHVVYKQCLKEVADQMGISVTFMAKPHADQAGSSCHVHLSLWADGQNAFAGDGRFGPVHCTEELSLVSRRMVDPFARVDGLLRAHGQLLQTLSARLMGANAYRLELRQSHGRLPRRWPRLQPAYRVAGAWRRLQSLPCLCRFTGVRTRWHR